MRQRHLVGVWFVAAGLLIGIDVPAAAAQAGPQAIAEQIAQLRQEFDALKHQYGDRLAALEASSLGRSRHVRRLRFRRITRRRW